MAFIHFKKCFMKAKLTILIATGLFLATVSKAQYGGGYADNQVSIQGQINIPGPAYVGFGYNKMYRERFDEHRDRRDGYNDPGNYGRYDNHRDWRAEAYERYCRETRGYRMCREEFYRDHCGYRITPYCAPRRVIVYGY
jgi:hypothetical protein